MQHFAQVALGRRESSPPRDRRAPAGGSSLTKRIASFVAMWRAVDGCAARMSSTRSPSSTPPALIVWPSTVFSPRSWRAGHEHEPRSLPRLHRPAGERARDVDDVLLRVAAVDAERVQLEQLARVVLVDAASIAARVPRATVGCASALERRRRTRCTSAHSCTRALDAQPVIEIEEHRGTLRRGAEHVRKLPSTYGRIASRSYSLT